MSPGMPFSYRFLDAHIAVLVSVHAMAISLLRWLIGFLVLIA